MENPLEGTVKIGPKTYTWEYNSNSHVFKAWDDYKVQVVKLEITEKAFEEIDVTALVKKEL